MDAPCRRCVAPGVTSQPNSNALRGRCTGYSRPRPLRVVLAQVFFAKVPRAATENDVMALFAGLGAVEDVVLFKASGAQHHKVGFLKRQKNHQS